MRTLKITLLSALFLFLLPTNSISQNQMLWIHEDHVKPSMAEEYKKVTKELVDACIKYNVPNLNWVMIRSQNGTYRYVSQIPNMAALDMNPFAALAERMGKEKLDALWQRMDKCYDRHNTFLVSNLKDLNYMPGAYSVSAPGKNYRKYHYFYVTPSTSDAVAANIKSITNLYVKKAAAEHYRVYRSGMGTEEEYYCVVIPAIDEADYKKTSDETEKLLGDEGKKLMDDLMNNVERYDTYSGSVIPELSYEPKKDTPQRTGVTATSK